MLSVTGRYIYITPQLKIINPIHEGTIFKYEGPIENYDFKNQSNNLSKIQEILGENGLCYVYVGKFMGERLPKVCFLAYSKDKTVWWRKYESGIEGGGENWIYDNGNRFKIKTWLKNNGRK